MNILYAVDVSESSSDTFSGSPVGDLNHDGKPNTVLDAEIANLINLTQQIRTLGFSPEDVTITVVPFNGSANPADATSASQTAANTATVTFGLGHPGDRTVSDFLSGLSSGGGTNFEDALGATFEVLQTLDQGGEKNVIYFLSDGKGTGSFGDEIESLKAFHHAQISAFGFGAGADLTVLNAIGNTGRAMRVTSANQLDSSHVGSPLVSGEVIDLDIFINGNPIPGVGPEDLIKTPDGLVLDARINGLARHAGETSAVSALLTLSSGQTLLAEVTVAGALPLSADLFL
jgi:hypothetical protein